MFNDDQVGALELPLERRQADVGSMVRVEGDTPFDRNLYGNMEPLQYAPPSMQQCVDDEVNVQPFRRPMHAEREHPFLQKVAGWCVGTQKTARVESHTAKPRGHLVQGCQALPEMQQEGAFDKARGPNEVFEFVASQCFGARKNVGRVPDNAQVWVVHDDLARVTPPNPGSGDRGSTDAGGVLLDGVLRSADRGRVRFRHVVAAVRK